MFVFQIITLNQNQNLNLDLQQMVFFFAVTVKRYIIDVFVIVCKIDLHFENVASVIENDIEL